MSGKQFERIERSPGAAIPQCLDYCESLELTALISFAMASDRRSCAEYFCYSLHTQAVTGSSPVALTIRFSIREKRGGRLVSL
ncbi:MAG: hypothetical protein Q8N47_21550 [Bryobacterales bacterium]|nr:hypothetical protein [Bryobacterales bacterium]